jgi:hypothetical protein
VRGLIGDRSLLHPPIPSDRVERAATGLLPCSDYSPQSSIVFNRSPVQYSYGEIEELIVTAQAVSSFERPWVTPDNVAESAGWVSGLYTAERSRTLVEQVYSAALMAYSELVDEWFPAWKPTLGWSAAFPIRLVATLSPRRGPGPENEPTLSLRPVPVTDSEGIGVSVFLADDEQSGGLGFRWDEEYWQSERARLVVLHPDTAPWVHISGQSGAFSVYGDSPATDLAYSWLWRDLHEVGLVPDRAPPEY